MRYFFFFPVSNFCSFESSLVASSNCIYIKFRVAHYGELSPECINAYYKYGRALLYKAQEEADPLSTVPKKEGESEQDSAKVGSDKNAVNGDSTAASGSSNAENDTSPNHQEGADDGIFLPKYRLNLLLLFLFWVLLSYQL